MQTSYCPTCRDVLYVVGHAVGSPVGPGNTHPPVIISGFNVFPTTLLPLAAPDLQRRGGGGGRNGRSARRYFTSPHQEQGRAGRGGGGRGYHVDIFIEFLTIGQDLP